MNVNWRRMVIGWMVKTLFVISIVPAGEALAQCPSKTKRMVTGATTVGVLGAAIGSRWGGQAAAIGGGSGAGLGALIGKRTPKGCPTETRVGQTNIDPRNGDARIPAGDENVSINESGYRTAYIRSINGADAGAISMILSEDMERNHYRFVDQRYFNEQNKDVHYYMDVTVRFWGQEQVNNNTGVFAGIINVNGGRMTSRQRYLVGITMFNGPAIGGTFGQNAPGRSKSLTVTAETYQSDNGWWNILTIYGSHYRFASVGDVATQATAAAIDYMMLGPR